LEGRPHQPVVASVASALAFQREEGRQQQEEELELDEEEEALGHPASCHQHQQACQQQ
jgi:hypothetical protein